MSTDPHTALMVTIANTHSPATPVPCVANPTSAWTSDDAAEQHEVARLCSRCPVLAACRTYIQQAKEPTGVWAGQTSHSRGFHGPRKPKEGTNR